MPRPGPLVAALAAALLLAAAPAGAQPDRSAAVPVTGGGSFHDAPLLKPGTYRDTLFPREVLYYAVDLKAGQLVEIDAVVDHDDPDRRSNIYAINVLDPMRAAVDVEDENESGRTSTSIHVVSARALTPQLELDDSSWANQYHGPGRYYIVIVDPGGFFASAVASDVVFELAVRGAPSDLPPSTPTPTATPRATATPRSAADDDDDGSPLAAALVGGGGLLAGALVGFGGVLAARRRRGLG